MGYGGVQFASAKVSLNGANLVIEVDGGTIYTIEPYAFGSITVWGATECLVASRYREHADCVLVDWDCFNLPDSPYFQEIGQSHSSFGVRGRNGAGDLLVYASGLVSAHVDDMNVNPDENAFVKLDAPPSQFTFRRQ